jgi:hypothetical protein
MADEIQTPFNALSFHTVETVKYDRPDNTSVTALIDGETWFGIVLAEESQMSRLVNAWIDEGNTPAAYVPPDEIPAAKPAAKKTQKRGD